MHDPNSLKDCSLSLDLENDLEIRPREFVYMNSYSPTKDM